MLNLLLSWLDLIWIPIAFLVTRRRHRFFAVAFMVLCSLTLRLEVDLIRSTGYNDGFIPFLWSGDVHPRAIVVYAGFSALYLLLLYAAPRAPWVLALSAGIVLYIAAFSVSMFVMAI